MVNLFAEKTYFVNVLLIYYKARFLNAPLKSYISKVDLGKVCGTWKEQKYVRISILSYGELFISLNQCLRKES